MINSIRIISLYLLLGLTTLLSAQNNAVSDSVSARFKNQVNIFPQEKIYLQTDRSDYISGERLWFKAYLVGALSHHHAIISRYIYVELIDPLNTVVNRVKIRPDSIGLFHGHININEEVAEGDYTLRAYTQYMRNTGNDYFFKKRIKIHDPASSSVETDIQFSFNKDKIQVDFKNNFKDGQPTEKTKKVLGRVNSEKEFNINLKNNSEANFSFKIPKNDSLRILTIAFDKDKRVYKQFISIPVPDDDFDISFLPEGGTIPAGVNWKVAFKCVQSNGLSSEVEGEIFDDNDNPIQRFSSTKNGMGVFYFQPDPQRKYYARCTANGITKKVEIPSPAQNYTGLSCNWDKEVLHVSPKTSPDSNVASPLYLMAHIRGNVIYNKQWDPKKEAVSFEKDSLPSGIVHFILYNDSFDIMSERLVFSLNENDIANVSFESDKPSYKTRDKIKAKLNFKDNMNKPLSGDVSISVIDNNDVKIDNSSNIISYLFLTSDLKGYIEQPATYFIDNKNESTHLLDLLMLTHGWRRYDIPKLIAGNLLQPNIPVEQGQTIKGKVIEAFGVVKNGVVSLLSTYDSIYAQTSTTTDEKGNFSFFNIEHRDSTKFTAKATTSKGSEDVELKVDYVQSFPRANSPIAWEKAKKEEEKNDLKIYIAKADMKYTYENGMRMINLGEVSIEAKKKMEVQSKYYSPLSAPKVITGDEIEKLKISNTKSLLMRLPGIRVVKGSVFVYGTETPLFIIDDRILTEGGASLENGNLGMLESHVDVHDIETIHVLKGAALASLGLRGASGAIVITTKKGKKRLVPTTGPNIQKFELFGYQHPAEFYSPKYETPNEKNSPNQDLRTTIYWKPDLLINDKGEANVVFYSADAKTNYSVLIEGVSNDGKLIHSIQKIEVSE